MQLTEQVPELTIDDIGPEVLQDLTDGQLLAVHAAFAKLWLKHQQNEPLPMEFKAEDFLAKFQFVIDEFGRRLMPENGSDADEQPELQESFHLKGPHWIEVPEDGACPTSHPNKDTSPDGKLKCYTNPAHASLLQFKMREQVEAPKNARGMDVAETFQAMQTQGRKFTQEEANFQQRADSPEKACGACRFYLRDAESEIGRCQAVEGPIPWFATSELYISAADEAAFAFEAAGQQQESEPLKEAFHIRGTHWEPLPASGQCSGEFSVRARFPGRDLMVCFTPSAARAAAAERSSRGE